MKKQLLAICIGLTALTACNKKSTEQVPTQSASHQKVSITESLNMGQQHNNGITYYAEHCGEIPDKATALAKIKPMVNEYLQGLGYDMTNVDAAWSDPIVTAANTGDVEGISKYFSDHGMTKEQDYYNQYLEIFNDQTSNLQTLQQKLNDLGAQINADNTLPEQSKTAFSYAVSIGSASAGYWSDPPPVVTAKFLGINFSKLNWKKIGVMDGIGGLGGLLGGPLGGLVGSLSGSLGEIVGESL